MKFFSLTSIPSNFLILHGLSSTFMDKFRYFGGSKWRRKGNNSLRRTLDNDFLYASCVNLEVLQDSEKEPFLANVFLGISVPLCLNGTTEKGLSCECILSHFFDTVKISPLKEIIISTYESFAKFQMEFSDFLYNKSNASLLSSAYASMDIQDILNMNIKVKATSDWYDRSNICIVVENCPYYDFDGETLQNYKSETYQVDQTPDLEDYLTDLFSMKTIELNKIRPKNITVSGKQMLPSEYMSNTLKKSIEILKIVDSERQKKLDINRLLNRNDAKEGPLRDNVYLKERLNFIIKRSFDLWIITDYWPKLSSNNLSNSCEKDKVIAIPKEKDVSCKPEYLRLCYFESLKKCKDSQTSTHPEACSILQILTFTSDMCSNAEASSSK